jgi:hypothetical protein
MRIIGLGNNNRIGQSGSILGRFKKGVIVNAPVASGTLPDQSTLTGTGTVTYTTAGAFTGTVVSYSLTGATTGISINTSTGVVSVDRALVVPATPTLIITATNSGGSAQASFSIDIIPQAPASGDWTLVDSADGTGLTLDVLTVPVWTTSIEYAISGVWTSISASGPITIDVNNAPIGTPVSVTLRWGVGTIDGSPSVAKVATATVPANIVQYVANGTVGAAPANWTSRWATGAMTYQADPARLQLTTGNGVFWSLDSDSGRDLSAVSGEIDFSGTFVLNATGEAEAGIGFWMNGTTVTSERKGFIAGIRENPSVKQVALYEYTANSPTTLTTNTHGYNQITGPGAAWTLRVRTRFISSTWRVYVKAWPNSVSEPIPWQIDAYTVTPSTTTGRIGIASRSVSSGAPFSVMTLNVGLNGADVPGATVAPGGSYKAGAALFVDLETGSDANAGTSSAAPLLTVPGNVDAGCVIKVRGKSRGIIAAPNGSTAGAGRVTLLGNDPTFAAGNRATLSGEADMTTMTNIGGNIWSGSLPATAWSLHPDTRLPYVEAIMYFRNGNTRMRLAQYPTQADLNNDQIFTNMFPMPLVNVTNSKNFVIPNDALSTIPNATIRAQVIADYPSATTIRDVVNAMHTAEALTVNSWFLMWGNHNTRQKGRIASYNPATGDMVLTDAVTVWSPGKDTYFSIMNHPSAIKMENQFIAGTASGQFKMMSATNPNGQVSFAQTKTYVINAFKNYVTVDGFIIEKASTPNGGGAPLSMVPQFGESASRTGMIVKNNIIRLCSVNKAAILAEDPVDSLVKGNVIEDIFGRGSLITGGSKCVIVGNTFARTSFTAFSVRYTTDYVVAGNVVNEVIGTHSDLGSLYEDNKRLIVVGNRLTLVADLEALNPGLTFHRFDDCLMAFNEVLVPNVAGLQQWSTSGPRTPTSGSNRYSNNTALHINPDRASNQNKSFNITSLANGQSIVTNNLTNALCFDAFEDAALTYGDPSFAWREVTANSATVSGSVTKADHTPKHSNPSILGNTIADSVNLVFSDVNAYVDIVIPSWGTAAIGAGVDSYIDLRQPVLTGRKIPAINGELIVTTTAGLLPTGTATWNINTTANTDTANGATWQTGNTIRVLGQAGATVTTVTIRLRPGAGFVAGVADSVLISRPRAWRDRAERLSRRRYNLTVSNQYGSNLDTLDRFTGVVSPLKNTVGPLPGNYDLAPRELSPGVLAEPKLAEGDAWTFSPAAAVGMTPVSVTWTGAVRPDGTRVDCTNVNWWGLGL